MKLVYATPSPFARKIRVLLQESGLDRDVEQLETLTTPVATPDDLSRANPLGKLPTLVPNDGRAIYDSRVISQFLNAEAGGGYYPEDKIWDVLTLEATADGIMDAALLMVYEHRVRPHDKICEGWVEAQWQKVDRAVRDVNARWMKHLAGPLDASHIALGCALGYLDFRLPDRNWRKDNDALDDWFAVFAQRPSMQATQPE